MAKIAAKDIPLYTRIKFTSNHLEDSSRYTVRTPLAGDVYRIQEIDGLYRFSTLSGWLKAVPGDYEFEVALPDFGKDKMMAYAVREPQKYKGVSIE